MITKEQINELNKKIKQVHALYFELKKYINKDGKALSSYEEYLRVYESTKNEDTRVQYEKYLNEYDKQFTDKYKLYRDLNFGMQYHWYEMQVPYLEHQDERYERCYNYILQHCDNVLNYKNYSDLSIIHYFVEVVFKQLVEGEKVLKMNAKEYLHFMAESYENPKVKEHILTLAGEM